VSGVVAAWCAFSVGAAFMKVQVRVGTYGSWAGPRHELCHYTDGATTLKEQVGVGTPGVHGVRGVGPQLSSTLHDQGKNWRILQKRKSSSVQ
jgi:hypothetical protein